MTCPLPRAAPAPVTTVAWSNRRAPPRQCEVLSLHWPCLACLRRAAMSCSHWAGAAERAGHVWLEGIPACCNGHRRCHNRSRCSARLPERLPSVARHATPAGRAVPAGPIASAPAERAARAARAEQSRAIVRWMRQAPSGFCSSARIRERRAHQNPAQRIVMCQTRASSNATFATS